MTNPWREPLGISNYRQTRELLTAISPYYEADNIVTSTENLDWRGEKYQSDLVMLDEEHNIGFEVLDNEIIIFYFQDHVHFEDYSSELEDGEPDYVVRAKEFLVNLFTREIRIEEYYKKNELVRDSYYFIMPDGDEYIGGTYYKFLAAVFCKKSLQKKTRVWKFNEKNK